MHTVVNKSVIKEVSVSIAVLHRKETVVDQEKMVNVFLDSILALRKFIDEKSESLESIEKQMVKLTHIEHSELLENDYKELRELIDEANITCSSLMRFYAALRDLREKGVINKEAKRYKIAVDDFKETISDLELAFFTLPATSGFKSTTDKLSALLG